MYSFEHASAVPGNLLRRYMPISIEHSVQRTAGDKTIADPCNNRPIQRYITYCCLGLFYCVHTESTHANELCFCPGSALLQRANHPPLQEAATDATSGHVNAPLMPPPMGFSFPARLFLSRTTKTRPQFDRKLAIRNGRREKDSWQGKEEDRRLQYPQVSVL